MLEREEKKLGEGAWDKKVQSSGSWGHVGSLSSIRGDPPPSLRFHTSEQLRGENVTRFVPYPAHHRISYTFCIPVLTDPAHLPQPHCPDH